MAAGMGGGAGLIEGIKGWETQIEDKRSSEGFVEIPQWEIAQRCNCGTKSMLNAPLNETFYYFVQVSL